MQPRLKTKRFHAYPLAQIAAVFAFGILASKIASVSLASVVILATLSAIFAALALFSERMVLATISITTLSLLLGFAAATVEQSFVPPNQLKRLLEANGKTTPTIALGEPVEITGVLERDPEIAPDRWLLNLSIERVRSRDVETGASGTVLLLVPAANVATGGELERLELRYGARIRVMTLLDRSDSFRNPGVSPFTEYLDRKGYDATGFVKSPLLIERLENTRVFLPLAWLYEWRRSLQAEINLRFSRETAGVLDAAFLGNRYHLSRETAARFREGGTFHVLVISGLHITFLGGLVFLIAKRFTKNGAWRFLHSVAVVWGYALAVGADPSVVRAALMFTLVVFAPIVSRRGSSLNALGGAALALLVWRPGDLFDPSFQLTFLSVLAMIVVAWPIIQKASATGSWRPTRQTPHPPKLARWLQTICEIIFWSEREWQHELTRTTYHCTLFKSPLAKILERYHLQRALRYMFAALVVSASVQLVLLPLLVVYFHRLSFASFVLNIGVSILMAGVALTATVALLLAQISSAFAAPVISLTNALNWLMVHSVDPFARIGVASLRLPEYTGRGTLVYVLYYVPLIAFVVFLARWQPLGLEATRSRPLAFFSGTKRIALIALLGQVLAIAVIVFHPFSESRQTGKLRVDFLDVGQGDAVFVTMPDNTALLIDGGGKPGPFANDADSAGVEESFERDSRSIGEAVVSEYLWWRGLDHVDYLIATHADADHIDGLNDVVRNFRVRAALVARTPDRDAEYAKFLGSLLATNTPIQTIGAGDVLRFGDVTAEVLWPMPTDSWEADSANNDSIVLRLRLGKRTILLTGDIETPAEKTLLQLHTAADGSTQAELGAERIEGLSADVVKVAHHGSKTSSSADFIAATDARWAIIPVGRTSMFGHPHEDVIARWRAAGAQVLTTGISGTITVVSDGQSVAVKTFVQPK